MKNERKEELKDEMKNRISLALKDPILQQGFEIICKENAEMKKELKDANEKVVHLACNQNKDLKYKLTNAKEILQEYIRINLLPPIERNFDDEVKLFKRAEQFLNSEVEK